MTVTAGLVEALPERSTAFATTGCGPFANPIVDTVSLHVPSAACFAVPILIEPVQ